MNFTDISRELGSRCEITGYANINPETSTGEHGKVVSWAREAWMALQREHEWNFLRKDFTFLTVPDQAVYAKAGIQAENAPVREIDLESVRIQREDIGVSDQQFLIPWDWDDWYNTYGYGSQVTARPFVFAIRPDDDAMALGSIPDANVYRVLGKYWRQAQRLTANTDIPIIDEELHMAIVYKGMLTYANRESAAEVKIEATERLDELMSLMRRRYLPAAGIRGTLA